MVLVPALAVDRAGNRLGRGGGSYDRALARVGPLIPVIALLYDDELLDQVPAEQHDIAGPRGRPARAGLTVCLRASHSPGSPDRNPRRACVVGYA